MFLYNTYNIIFCTNLNTRGNINTHMKYVYLYIIFYNFRYDCFYSIYIYIYMKAFIWIHITHASPAVLSHLYVWIGITQHKENLILNSLMKILYSPHYIIPFHLNTSYIILCTEFFKDTRMLFIWKTKWKYKNTRQIVI